MNYKTTILALCAVLPLHTMEQDYDNTLAYFANLSVTDPAKALAIIKEYSDCRGNTLLHIAVEKNYAPIVTFLMDNYPDMVNTYNNEQFTPLHIAAWYNRHELLDIMLDNEKTDVNRPSALLQTPLHLAAINKSYPAMKSLLEHPKVDSLKKDIFGHTPTYHIQQNNILFDAFLPPLAAACLLINVHKKNLPIEPEKTE